MKIRPLAIYLPQFHPIPENDKWWGKGFTEWTNVTRSVPKFKGHYQPHLPSDLGFYDLRLPETIKAQSQMAKEYGIQGFCFYHYWFDGKWYLERPLFDILNNKDLDIEYCFCWANGDWVKSWKQQDEKVLLKQVYSPANHYKHIRELIPFFKDDRYIKIDGKPVFVIYRSELFPDLNKALDIYRIETKKAGFPDLYLIRVESFQKNVNPQQIGFDAAVDFHPDWSNYPKNKNLKKIISRLLRIPIKGREENIFNYQAYVEKIKNRPGVKYKRFPCVMPQWDNSPRRQKGATIIKNSTPDLFKDWVNFEYSAFQPFSEEENLFFINAWNEWAEGNHMEPCQKWGLSYLKAFKEAFN